MRSKKDVRFKGREHVDEGKQIKKDFYDKQLFALRIEEFPLYADIVNLLVNGIYPPSASFYQKNIEF